MLSSTRQRLRARDPGGRALRKATRLALVLPITLLLAFNIPYLKDGALYAAFSCLAQLTFADFGPESCRFSALRWRRECRRREGWAGWSR